MDRSEVRRRVDASTNMMQMVRRRGGRGWALMRRPSAILTDNPVHGETILGGLFVISLRSLAY